MFRGRPLKSVGILGLPRSGRTTLFEILMQGAGSAAAAAGSREAVGVVRVPDERVDRLSSHYQPKKTTHAVVQFVESAAADPGARATRKSDPFASVRNCDGLLAVVRAFEDAAAAAGPDPERDRRTIEADLILSDLAILESRIEKLEKELRVGKKEGEREHRLLRRCHERLESGEPMRAVAIDPEEEKIVRGFQLLSRKPLLVVYNQDEQARGKPADPGPGALVVALRAHIEREILNLPREEREAFRAEMGVEQDGLSLLIRACYRLLGLISFFTVGPDEVRAWTLREGQTAVDAAGEIHSDLARGFIRAETIAWDRLLEAGGQSKAREKGWLRLEGREYVVRDGECIEIRFNR
jgi:GTP-binding protein YchF